MPPRGLHTSRLLRPQSHPHYPTVAQGDSLLPNIALGCASTARLIARESLVLQQWMEPSKRALQNMLPVTFHIACPWIFEYRTWNHILMCLNVSETFSKIDITIEEYWRHGYTSDKGWTGLWKRGFRSTLDYALKYSHAWLSNQFFESTSWQNRYEELSRVKLPQVDEFCACAVPPRAGVVPTKSSCEERTGY